MKRLLGIVMGLFLLWPAAASANDGDPNWEGFYVGGLVGGTFLTFDIDDYWCWYACDAPTATSSDIALGGTLGYNHPVSSNFVIGIEADIQTGGDDSRTVHWNTNPDGVNWSEELNWIATVRARAGLMVQDTLAYATVGVVFADGEYSAHEIDDGVTDCGNGEYCADWDGTQTGFVAGGGVEHLVSDHWSVKLEYLYFGLPDESACYRDNFSNACNNGPGQNDDFVNWATSGHLVRFGVNYGF